MNKPVDSSYSHTRASGTMKFLVVQALLLSVGTAWGAVRIRQLDLMKALPPLRSAPLEVRPNYDYPVVVSDEQLSRILTKLRPKKLGAKTKLNHVDHALRMWTTKAVFKDPNYFSGEEMRAVLTDHRRFAELYGKDQPPLLIDTPAGVRVRLQEGNATSSHLDHTLAGLAEVGTPLDFPIVTPTRTTTYRAMLDEAFHHFQLNQVEYEWSAMAMISFLPPQNRWIDSEGQEITFDRLAVRLMREEMPRGVCFGNHRLYTLTLFLRIDDEYRVLTPHVRTQVVAFLMNMTGLLARHQHSDGYWDGKWPLRPTPGDVKENVTGDATADRILATGHALEWWAMAPVQCHPPRETLAKAGQWLVRTLDALTPEQTENYYTYLTHAGRSLALWRAKLPYEVPLDEASPTP